MRGCCFLAEFARTLQICHHGLPELEVEVDIEEIINQPRIFMTLQRSKTLYKSRLCVRSSFQ